MKSLFLITIFLMLSLCVFSQNPNGIAVQQNNQAITATLEDSVTVAISPGTENTTTIANLNTVLKTFNGVFSSNYCSSHNIYLIRINPTVYTTKQLFYNNLKTVSNINSLLLKEGNVQEALSALHYLHD